MLCFLAVGERELPVLALGDSGTLLLKQGFCLFLGQVLVCVGFFLYGFGFFLGGSGVLLLLSGIFSLLPLLVLQLGFHLVLACQDLIL